MTNPIKDLYSRYLNWRLASVTAELESVMTGKEGTEPSDYTEGYLAYLDRKMEYLGAASLRLNATLNRLHPAHTS